MNAMLVDAVPSPRNGRHLFCEPSPHCVAHPSAAPPLKEKPHNEEKPKLIDIDKFSLLINSAIDSIMQDIENEVSFSEKYIVKINGNLGAVGQFYLSQYTSKKALNLLSTDTNIKETFFEFGGSKILLFKESDAKKTVGRIYRVNGEYFQQFISKSNYKLDQSSENHTIVGNSEHIVFRQRIDYGITPISSFYEPDFLMIHMLYFCNFSIDNDDYSHN
jgi:hypothetical protein